MRRRHFIGLLGGAAAGWPWAAANAQDGRKIRRLAILSPFEPVALMREDSTNRYYRVLFEELRRLGHIEGWTLSVERYGREQAGGGMRAMVADLVRSGPDCVYSLGGSELLKGTNIPVVAMSPDPVASGLVQSLARPGGNITGVSVDAGPAIYGKRIELLREAVPQITKLGYVTFRLAWELFQGAGVRAAAATSGLALAPALLELPLNKDRYHTALAGLVGEGANAIMIGDTPDAMENRASIVALVAETRLPALYTFTEFVTVGGLMAYSYDLAELNRRVANDIDAIFRGASPADIPYYQASKFVLSLNLKTAQAQGITFAPSMLARADEIVE